jgi:type I restriction enzyme M protein
MQRDKINLDIFWIKDKSLEDSEKIPDPDVLASDIIENLQSALEQFENIYRNLNEK